MSKTRTCEEARGRWFEILTALGVDPKYLKNTHGPCPMCGGKDRWRWDDRSAGTYYCSGCGAGDGFNLLQKLYSWDFKRAAAEIDQVLGLVKLAQGPRADRSPEQKLAGIRRLLRDARQVAPGCPSWRYLERRCGVVSGDALADLRHHDQLSYAKGAPGAFPGLLAILRYANGKGASVHRTFLTLEGFKANLDPVRKVMPGLPLDGASVRLGEAQEVLGIAEGIETALCASKLFGMPVWSAISANGILNWAPPPEVKAVVIFGDNDSSFIGQAAAYDKAKILRHHGLDVEIQIPSTVGTDWCDVWGESNRRGVS